MPIKSIKLFSNNELVLESALANILHRENGTTHVFVMCQNVSGLIKLVLPTTVSLDEVDYNLVLVEQALDADTFPPLPEGGIDALTAKDILRLTLQST